MTAVLRAHGKEFDVDAFATASTLPIIAIKRRGEPIHPKTQPYGRRHLTSAIHFDVSDADFSDFEQQVTDATRFLTDHAIELRRLVSSPGYENATLDFGVENRSAPAQCHTLPPELIRLAAVYNFEIELSLYAIAPENEVAESN